MMLAIYTVAGDVLGKTFLLANLRNSFSTNDCKRPDIFVETKDNLV